MTKVFNMSCSGSPGMHEHARLRTESSIKCQDCAIRVGAKPQATRHDNIACDDDNDNEWSFASPFTAQPFAIQVRSPVPATERRLTPL